MSTSTDTGYSCELRPEHLTVTRVQKTSPPRETQTACTLTPQVQAVPCTDSVRAVYTRSTAYSAEQILAHVTQSSRSSLRAVCICSAWRHIVSRAATLAIRASNPTVLKRSRQCCVAGLVHTSSHTVMATGHERTLTVTRLQPTQLAHPQPPASRSTSCCSRMHAQRARLSERAHPAVLGMRISDSSSPTCATREL